MYKINIYCIPFMHETGKEYKDPNMWFFEYFALQTQFWRSKNDNDSVLVLSGNCFCWLWTK